MYYNFNKEIGFKELKNKTKHVIFYLLEQKKFLNNFFFLYEISSK